MNYGTSVYILRELHVEIKLFLIMLLSDNRKINDKSIIYDDSVPLKYWDKFRELIPHTKTKSSYERKASAQFRNDKRKKASSPHVTFAQSLWLKKCCSEEILYKRVIGKELTLRSRQKQ